MNQQQFNAITEWQNKTFGQATPLSKIRHLEQELEELEVDIVERCPPAIKNLEWADCFILLFGAAASDGMNYEDICKAIDDKMTINYNRKWGKPNANGVVNHIKH